jgi:hypothetical protein
MLKADDSVILMFGVIVTLMMTALLPISTLFLLNDLVGFRFRTSALFDRHAGKVHLFRDRSRPWAPWRTELVSYDWTCVRAEIDTLSSETNGIIVKEAGIRCVVLDSVDGNTVIDQFVLGALASAKHIQPLLDTWEHVRRFMQLDGPLFADQFDGPNDSLGRQPLWKHLMAWPQELIQSTYCMFKLAWATRSIYAAIAALCGLLAFAIIWLPMLWGFLPWMSELAKRDPVWSKRILDSVGGAALSGSDLATWREVIPVAATQVDRN